MAKQNFVGMLVLRPCSKPPITKVRAIQVFHSFHTTERTLNGIESMHMMRKKQVKRFDWKDAMGQAKFVESLFGVAAQLK
jgi:hypothetical protein